MNAGLTPIDELISKIKNIHAADPQGSEIAIENYLKEQLGYPPTDQAIKVLEDISYGMRLRCSPPVLKQHPQSEELSRLLSLLLGKDFSVSEVSFEEFVSKVTHSLNTVFDYVNQLVSVIRGTLLGEKVELETIRLIIGSQLEGKKPAKSLESYMGQIKEAFVLAHKAFQEAAQAKVAAMLTELDPSSIQKTESTSLKFGPLRKAELFEIYKERFSKCRSWFESGRFNEELLREFERICQEHYK